jgi:hypothetical protein
VGLKIHLKDNVMEITEEYEQLITNDDIEWCWNRLIVMTATIVCGGRGSKHQILRNLWNLVTEDLIDDSSTTLIDLEGFKSWFLIRKEIKMSSVFSRVMKDWYTARFANKEVSVDLYNELASGLRLIHYNIKNLDNRYSRRFDNWAWGANSTPICIDFNGDDIDTIELEKGDVES